MREVDFPEKLQCLFDESVRYIILYGGRGAGRSWGVARALLLRGAQKPMRILCCREFMTSLRDSVHQLLRDQIQEMGLDDFYTVQTSQIVGRNLTTFGFLGLRHNTANIKSWEGADVAWCEEAEKISKSSWDTLIPTIRKENSQIIATFNPDIEESETYQRFVANPPKDSIVMKMTYRDNPWFPDVLEKERLALKERDPIAYENIWEGNPLAAIEGSIFAKELQLATEEGRIRDVPYDSAVPVSTYWDLGHSDQTAIWFAQIVGMEYRILHCYANSQEKLHHYIKYVQSQPYTYANHFFPHDAAHEQLGSERTIEKQARDALKSVTVIPRVDHKANAIEAGRSLFPLCYFDREGCADGLSALRHYRYKIDEQTGRISKEPVHDIHSHYADAWLSLAMSLRKPKEKRIQQKQNLPRWVSGVI